MLNIGYKKASNGYIVKLEILGRNNEHREGIKPEHVPFAKYACSEARVLDIYHSRISIDPPRICVKEITSLTGNLVYKVGSIVKPDSYDPMFGHGIHYFKSEEPAIMYGLNVNNYTGKYKSYHNNGQLRVVCSYKDGKLDGEYASYYAHGTMAEHAFYKDGEHDGPFVDYHPNGQLASKGCYKQGQLDGKYVSYGSNGKLDEEFSCKDGDFDGDYITYYPNGQISDQYFYKNGQFILFFAEKKYVKKRRPLDRILRLGGSENPLRGSEPLVPSRVRSRRNQPSAGSEKAYRQ